MFKRFSAISAVFVLFAGIALAQPAQDVEEVTTDSPNANVGTEAAADRTVDTTTTTTAMASQTAKTFFDGAVTFANSKVKFQLFSSDNFYADKIVYKLNDGADTDYSTPFSIDQEGKFTVKYHGIDKVGNIEDDRTFNVVIDNTAPEITVAPKAPLVLVNGTYYTSRQNSFTVYGSDNLSGYYMSQYSVNGQDFAEYASTFSIWLDGDTTLTIKSEDNVANATDAFNIVLPAADGTQKAESVTSLKVFVDNVVPTVEIKSDKPLMNKGGKLVASKEYKFAVTGEDKESGLKQTLVRVDGKGEFMPYEKEIQFKSNGDHYIEAKTVDAVGNVSQTTILPVYVDIIPPKSEIKAVTE